MQPRLDLLIWNSGCCSSAIVLASHLSGCTDWNPKDPQLRDTLLSIHPALPLRQHLIEMQGSLSSLFLGTKWSWIRGDCDTDNSSQRSHLVANSLSDHRWLTKCWGYPVCGFSPLDVTWLPGAPQQRPSSCAHQTSWCHEVLPHISLATQGFLARAGKGYCSWPETKHDVFL